MLCSGWRSARQIETTLPTNPFPTFPDHSHPAAAAWNTGDEEATDAELEALGDPDHHLGLLLAEQGKRLDRDPAGEVFEHPAIARGLRSLAAMDGDERTGQLVVLIARGQALQERLDIEPARRRLLPAAMATSLASSLDDGPMEAIDGLRDLAGRDHAVALFGELTREGLAPDTALVAALGAEPATRARAERLHETLAAAFRCVEAYVVRRWPDYDFSPITDRLYRRYLRLEDLAPARAAMDRIGTAFADIASADVDWSAAGLASTSSELVLDRGSLGDAFARFLGAFGRAAKNAESDFVSELERTGATAKQVEAYRTASIGRVPDRDIYYPVMIMRTDDLGSMMDEQRPLDLRDKLTGPPLWLRPQDDPADHGVSFGPTSESGVVSVFWVAPRQNRT